MTDNYPVKGGKLNPLPSVADEPTVCHSVRSISSGYTFCGNRITWSSTKCFRFYGRMSLLFYIPGGVKKMKMYKSAENIGGIAISLSSFKFIWKVKMLIKWTLHMPLGRQETSIWIGFQPRIISFKGKLNSLFLFHLGVNSGIQPYTHARGFHPLWLDWRNRGQTPDSRAQRMRSVKPIDALGTHILLPWTSIG